MASDPSTALTRTEQDEVRSRIFRHDDGIGVGPALVALLERGVLGLLRQRGRLSVGEAVAHADGQRGYLHIALRLLASQGWVVGQGAPASDALTYQVTARGARALAHAERYREPVAFLPQAVRMADLLAGRGAPGAAQSYAALVERARAGWELAPAEGEEGAAREQVRHHLDGLLAGPAVIALKEAGSLDRFRPESPVLDLGSLGGDRAAMDAAFSLLAHFGWVEKDGPHLQATPRGLFAFGSSRAWAYGVPVSYLPLLSRVEQLIWGRDPGALFGRDEAGSETHVNRAMNVRASGAAHTPYFRTIDQIVAEVFSRPLAEQPKFVCDMGSGDGTFLRHLYEVIERTSRGAAIRSGAMPLLMIGADYNADARHATSATLQGSGIPHRVFFGDINDPDGLAAELARAGIAMGEGMHVRSFLDHNRPYTGVRDPAAAAARAPRSTGAFAWRGRAVPNGELEQNLVEHFRRWAPYAARYGLLCLELHTLSAPLAAANVGRTLATGYDATHGFSDQFTVEAEVFLACAREAGLAPDPRHAARFPNSELATVTINLFRAEP